MGVKLSIEKVKERLLNNMKVTDNGCWEWQKYRWLNYGRANLLGERLAHRISFIVHCGPIPKGAFVCHKCDNPPCINPEHLFLGTNQDNMIDCSDKGRTANHNSYKTHCKNGHKFTLKNTYINPRGERICRTCSNEWASNNYRKNIEESRRKQREYRLKKKIEGKL